FGRLRLLLTTSPKHVLLHRSCPGRRPRTSQPFPQVRSKRGRPPHRRHRHDRPRSRLPRQPSGMIFFIGYEGSSLSAESVEHSLCRGSHQPCVKACLAYGSSEVISLVRTASIFFPRILDRASLSPIHVCLSPLSAVRPLLGSSVAEQVTVNHLVAGSIPARAAIKQQNEP